MGIEKKSVFLSLAKNEKEEFIINEFVFSDENFAKEIVLKHFFKKYDKEFTKEAKKYISELDFLEKDRKSLIVEAIEMHELEKYNFSIPVLLMNVEGLLLENTTEFIRSNGILKKYYNLQDEPVHKHFIYTSVLSYEKHIKIGFESKTYEELPNLNRNTILHGRNIYYGTKENSITTILLILLIIYLKKDKREGYEQNGEET